ncbi:MAG: DUF445 family protein [Treponema sp.]|nr:DUF445 family protein [Treponema sp.]
MNPGVVFFIPPVVGALIGYSTNVLAIRMLFRPLREIRIFGIRLPFTPGILPKQRHRLAESIGGMVERELITPEIIRRRLANRDVREKVKLTISLFTGKILEKRPSELLEGNEEKLSEMINGAAEKMYPSFASALISFLHRDEIRRELESKGRVFLKSIILKLNVFQRFFISAAQYDATLEQKMPEIIDELTENSANLLQDEKVKNMFVKAVTAEFNRMIGEQNKNIGGLFNINENSKEKLDEFLFTKLMVSADGQIENILASINIKSLVVDRIDSLDMVKVERIILDIMSDQFKWVEIFGGILGFLIGMFQSGLNQLLR